MEKICVHCSCVFALDDKPLGFMANHSRWCVSNPKRKKYVDDLKSRNSVELMNNSKQNSKFTNQFAKAKLQGKEIPTNQLKGKKHPNPLKKHSEKSKQIMREKALASTHRRLKRNIVVYNNVNLDSSWELALAVRLDSQKIKWERPKPIQWVDDKGLKHNYFPDFYLPEFDVYLDPKNPYAYKIQRRKIEILNMTYANIIWITSLEECNIFTL